MCLILIGQFFFGAEKKNCKMCEYSSWFDNKKAASSRSGPRTVAFPGLCRNLGGRSLDARLNAWVSWYKCIRLVPPPPPPPPPRMKVLTFKGTVIVTIRADFQQAWNRCSSFKMNTVTENYWLIYAAATVIWSYHVGIIFSHWVNLKLALRFHALLIMMILSL